MWLEAWRNTPAAQQVQWLIVPRHPQRFDAVAQLFTEAGLRVARRGRWGERLPPHDVDVWLGDSLGEMPLYYASAHAALLGASFAPLGGQNLIEAAACACPIVVGPHTFNFGLAAEQACACGAALRASDMQDAVELALGWLHSSAHLQVARSSALAFAQAHRGAAQAQAQAIVRVMLEKECSMINKSIAATAL